MRKNKYDYLIVGAGLFGATIAYRAKQQGKSCLVIDKRPHLGGNVYCKNEDGIHVHQYGAHIFHTSSKQLWDFVNSLVEFNNYINSPIANYQGKIYNLPFNMNTFCQLWGITTPEEAKAKIEEQRKFYGVEYPSNLEEQAISLVGKDIYETLIKEYTEKQWGRAATELPAFIIKRLPVRFTFNNNYFNDRYQGIPVGGYNVLINKMLEGVEYHTNTNYFDNREMFNAMAEKVVFTGKIDEFFGYALGKLEYRSLKFEHKRFEMANYQGNAVVNYTSKEVPYTRVIEHKHFEFGTQPHTVVTREYSIEGSDNVEPYYPINDERNNQLYTTYKEMADQTPNVIFGGRLAEYKYYDMNQVIEKALDITL